MRQKKAIILKKAIQKAIAEQKDKNGHKIGADGKLVFDALCQGCDAPEQERGMWSDKEYIENLHFILGDLTDHKWKIVLALIQGKINHVKQAAVAEERERVKGIVEGMKNEYESEDFNDGGDSEYRSRRIAVDSARVTSFNRVLSALSNTDKK